MTATVRPEDEAGGKVELEQVATRRLVVPSHRELEAGEQLPPRPPRAAGTGRVTLPRAERPNFRTAVRSYLGGIDPRKIEGPRVVLVVLSLSAVFGSWDDNAIGLFFPEIRREFNIDIQFLLNVGTITGAFLTLVNPVMGYVADRVNRVRLFRFGAIAGNAVSVAQGLAPTVPFLVGAQVTGGLVGGISGPARGPLIADYFPSTSRARAFAFLAALGGLGAVIGRVVAGYVGEQIGWRATVVILGVVATAFAFGTFLLREPKRGEMDRLEMGATVEQAAREQAAVTWAEAWRASAAIVTVRRLWYATPFNQVGGSGLGILTGLYFASEFNLGPSARANIGVLGSLVSVAGLVAGAGLADRLIADRPSRMVHGMALISLLNAISVVVLVVTNNLWIAILFTLPVSFAGAMLGPAYLTLFTLIIPARLRGLGVQTIAPWTLIGLALQPFIASYIGSHTLRSGMLAFAPLVLIGGIITWSTAFAVEGDIRNARAASMADFEAEEARAAGQGKIVICRDVDVHYDGVQILFGVDFDVQEGEIVALLGTNGAGKSTLLRAVAGLTEPTAGAILIDGRDTTHLPPHQIAAIGVAQSPGGKGVFPTLTVAENLDAAAWLVDEPAAVAERRAKVEELFPVLRERLGEQAGALSGGEQQMIALAQAFIQHPRLLLIDELSLGLAPGVVAQLLDALRDMRAAGTTIVVVEQSVNLALTIADRAVFMEKGEVRFSGPTAELLQRRDILRSVFLRSASSRGGSRRARTTSELAAAAGLATVDILTVQDAAVQFGGVRALRGASLGVRPNEIVGLIGPNGAGKTTLFDVISGFVTPDTGQVGFAGQDITTLPPDARARLGLGRSFQDSRLFPSMTVRENVLVALERHLQVRTAFAHGLRLPAARRSEVRAGRRAEALIELLGLGGFRDKLVGELSTGSRRLVDLACAMASDPDVLLLDEPSSGIAQVETVELGPVLHRLSRDADCALLVIEHDMDLITSISDRLVVMELGAVIAEGPPAEVVEDPRVITAYLGGADELIVAPATDRSRRDT